MLDTPGEEKQETVTPEKEKVNRRGWGSRAISRSQGTLERDDVVHLRGNRAAWLFAFSYVQILNTKMIV